MYTAYFLSLSALLLYVQETLGYVGSLVPSFGDASLMKPRLEVRIVTSFDARDFAQAREACIGDLRCDSASGRRSVRSQWDSGAPRSAGHAGADSWYEASDRGRGQGI